jgi:CO/xanthine dehydrogenase Mo-binding subunit
MPGVRHIVALDTGIAVVADTFWQASSAADLLDIQWDPALSAGLSTRSIMSRWEEMVQGEGKAARDDGDAAGVLDSAAGKISATYSLPYQAHACPEPMNCTAHVRRDSCDIWAPTQAQGVAQDVGANVCGLDLDRVNVHTTYLGGGFGRRGLSDFVSEAVRISKAVDAPVKLVWTREEDMRNDFFRPASHNFLRAGLDENGLPVAWIHRAVGSVEFEALMAEAGPAILPAWLPRPIKNWAGHTVASLILRARGSEDAMGGAATMVYQIPNVRIEHIKDRPGVPVGFWRSVADSRNAFVVESFMDEIAVASGLDPVQLRLKLLTEFPRESRVLQLAADKSGWGKSSVGDVFQGVALHTFHHTPVAMVAEVSVGEDGKVKVHRVVCAVDCGTVINPKIVEAQLISGVVFGLTATLKSSVTVEKGQVQEANFDGFPLLRMNEMPAVEVYIADSRRPPSGIGEVGVPPISPAVTNAIFAATGKRVRRLPVERNFLAGSSRANG